MGLFGPSKREVWKALAREIGALYVEGGFWKEDRVQARLGPWAITLDTYSVHSGHAQIVFTRLRAPYVNPEGFRFKAYRKGFFSEFGKLLGMQHVNVDHPEIDERFILKGNQEPTIRALFEDPEVCDLALTHLQKGGLEVKDKEGWLISKYPPETDLLYYQITGVLRDTERLRGLIDLFAAVLDRLEQLGAAVAGDPGVVI